MKIYGLLFALLLLVYSASVINAQTKKINFTKGAKLVKKTHTDSDKEHRYRTRVEYPQLIGFAPELAKGFNADAQFLAETPWGYFVAAMSMQTYEELESLKKRGVTTYSNVSYEVEYANDNLISIRFTNDFHIGGSRPESKTFTVTYLLEKGEEDTLKRLKLKDLFRTGDEYLGVISEESINQLEKKLNSPRDGWIRKGTESEASNFKSWNLTPEGLLLSFDPYQVASYEAGRQEVLIPYRRLRKYLSGEYEFEPFNSIKWSDTNPLTWCDSKDIADFRLARVKGGKSSRAYFYGVEGNESYQGTMPNAKKYRKKSYLVAGDEVLVLAKSKSWACSWYQPKKDDGTYGWIKLSDLSIVNKPPIPQLKDWMGNWAHSDISYLRLTPGKKNGFIRLWGQGEEEARDGVASSWIEKVDIKPLGIRMVKNMGPVRKPEEAHRDECALDLYLLSDYLLAKDNDKCGIGHITFTGIYRRQ